MLLKKMGKLNVFLLLLVLVNISRQGSAASILTKGQRPQEASGDGVTVENIDVVKGELELSTAEGELDENAIVTEADAVEVVNDSDNDVVDVNHAKLPHGESITDSENDVVDVNNTELPNGDSVIDSEDVVGDAADPVNPVTESGTDQTECACDFVGNDNENKVICVTQPSEDTQTEANALSPEVTTPSAQEVTSVDEIKNVTTTESDAKTDATTITSIDLETTVRAPASCSVLGVQAHESNCQQYYECSSEGSVDGSLYLLVKTCPEKHAFNIELNRCGRDISNCSSLPIQCLLKGGIADPASNSAYYLCEPRIIGAGYRIFHVDCSSHEIFYPEIGKCFVDLNNLPPLGSSSIGQVQDIDIVRAEIKLLKKQDKLKLKQEKERKKAEEKLQKEIERENKKRAKEEAATFVCVQEGNYPSQFLETSYITCVNKKGTLKATAMQCAIGTKFDASTTTCIVDSKLVITSSSEEDDD